MSTTPNAPVDDRAGRAGPRLRRASDVVLRVGVLALGVMVVGAAAWYLKLVVLPILVAALLCTALVPPVVALERRGVRPLLATWMVFGGSLLVLGGIGWLVVPPTVDQFAAIGEVVSDGVDDVEEWLVEGPLSLDRDQVREYTRDPVGRAAEVLRSSSDQVVAGARAAGEVAVGALLALVLTFLFLKDGRRLLSDAVEQLPERHRRTAREVGQRVWDAFGGFLRGAAILGTVEGAIIGGAMAVLGAPLALPVAVLTFFGAFFPIVGAVVAGSIAVLVTLATVGVGPAIGLLVLVVVVQQLDSDLLAPFIYGSSLQLHPAAVLVALTIGGSLGGIIGAFVAVPMLGATWGAVAVLWERRAGFDPPDDAATVHAEPTVD
jgi:predicted PurR-regulated permease PerM